MISEKLSDIGGLNLINKLEKRKNAFLPVLCFYCFRRYSDRIEIIGP